MKNICTVVLGENNTFTRMENISVEVMYEMYRLTALSFEDGEVLSKEEFLRKLDEYGMIDLYHESGDNHLSMYIGPNLVTIYQRLHEQNERKKKLYNLVK